MSATLPLLEPSTHKSFTTLVLRSELGQSLARMGLTEMTAIQAASLPHLLAGEDIFAQAKTGSGKTIAYALALLNQVVLAQREVQGLVLCPTRELAAQTTQVFRDLAKHLLDFRIVCLAGGAGLGIQTRSLKVGVHLVIATPGRLLKHLKIQTLDLRTTKCLVLDEADRMLSLGFYEDIQQIIQALPTQRQSLLFSATYDTEVESASKQFQNKARSIRLDTEHQHPQIEQIYFATQEAQRFNSLVRLLQHYPSRSTLIFCNTKRGCDDLNDRLQAANYPSLVMHGDLEQEERNQVLLRFANGSSPILIATDVAARGLDIRELGLVINYELANHTEMHIHRIGRTGRAGEGGLALSLYSPAEHERLARIQSLFPQPLAHAELPKPKTSAATEQRTQAPMRTLAIAAGRKNKLRATDILGALTQQAGVPGSEVGKIDVLDFQSYVAVQRNYAEQALDGLLSGTIKGRKFKVRILH